jgi:hypothetical protein
MTGPQGDFNDAANTNGGFDGGVGVGGGDSGEGHFNDQATNAAPAEWEQNAPAVPAVSAW